MVDEHNGYDGVEKNGLLSLGGAGSMIATNPWFLNSGKNPAKLCWYNSSATSES